MFDTDGWELPLEIAKVVVPPIVYLAIMAAIILGITIVVSDALHIQF